MCSEREAGCLPDKEIRPTRNVYINHWYQKWQLLSIIQFAIILMIPWVEVLQL